MNRGILKTALTTTIRLDLTYREPSSTGTPVWSEAKIIHSHESQPMTAPNRGTLLRMRWMFVGDVR